MTRVFYLHKISWIICILPMQFLVADGRIDESNDLSRNTFASPRENPPSNCLPNVGEAGDEFCLTPDKAEGIGLGQTFDHGNHTYQCQVKPGGQFQLCAVGCIYNGNHFKIGEQYMDGEFVYYCKQGRNGQPCSKICIGCQFGDQKLYNGDRYHKDGSAYQCVIRPNRSIHKPVACVTNGGVERVVGCKWKTTTKDSKVEQTCVVRRGRSVVEATGCVFVHNGYDRLFLYPGTYTYWSEFLDGKQMVVKCGVTGDEKAPLLETFDMSELGEKTKGLKFDHPRG